MKLLGILDDWRNAVIGRQPERPFARANRLVQPAEKVAELAVSAIRHVFALQAVRPEGMPHKIVRGEINAEQIGDLIPPQLLPENDGPRRIERDLVAKRRNDRQVAELNRIQRAGGRQLMRELA